MSKMKARYWDDYASGDLIVFDPFFWREKKQIVIPADLFNFYEIGVILKKCDESDKVNLFDVSMHKKWFDEKVYWILVDGRRLVAMHENLIGLDDFMQQSELSNGIESK